MIDKRTGHVAYAVLSFGGFLGMGTDHYPLPWSMLNMTRTWAATCQHHRDSSRRAEI